MIDDLQFMNQKEDNYEISKEECMDLFAKRLKNLAINLDVPLILNTQLSRDVEWRENKRPVIRDIPGTDGLVNNAAGNFISRSAYEREQRIAEGLEAAKKADDSLEEAKLMYDKELSKAKKEAAEIIDKANSRASQIVLDAKTKAEEEAEKIMTSANTTIESETNRAKEELRQQMSDIIIDTTKKILDEEISVEKHDALLKKAAKEL